MTFRYNKVYALGSRVEEIADTFFHLYQSTELLLGHFRNLHLQFLKLVLAHGRYAENQPVCQACFAFSYTSVYCSVAI